MTFSEGLKELANGLDVQVEELDLSEDKANDTYKLLANKLREKLSIVRRNAEFETKKTVESQVRSELYGETERKVKTKIENLLKEKFDISETEAKSLEDLVEEISLKKPTSSKLTEDDVIKHPLFAKFKNDVENKYKSQLTEKEQELENFKTSVQREKIVSKVSKLGLSEFEKLNPVLSKNAEKAQAQKRLIAKELSQFEWEEQDGKFFASKDGQLLKDDYQNPLGIDAIVKKVSEPLFDFHIAEERKSPSGEGNPEPPGGIKYNGAMPKSSEELVELINDSKIPLEQRIELSQKFENHKWN